MNFLFLARKGEASNSFLRFADLSSMQDMFSVCMFGSSCCPNGNTYLLVSLGVSLLLDVE